MSERTPAGQGADKSAPGGGDRDPDARAEDPSRNEDRKPTLEELLFGGGKDRAPEEDHREQEEPSGRADEPKEHKPSLADLMAAGQGVSEPDKAGPDKAEVRLEELVAKALAEADAQAAEAEAPEEAEQQEEAELDLPEQLAPEPAEVEPEPAEPAFEPAEPEVTQPPVAAAEAPPVVQTPPRDQPLEQEARVPEADILPDVVEEQVVAEEPPQAQELPQEAVGVQEPVEPAPVAAVASAGVVGGPSVVARYGRMRLVGQFRHSMRTLPAPGAKVVVRTHRGVELAKVLSCVCQDGRLGCITHECLVAYVEANQGAYPVRCEGNVLRVANQQDLTDHERAGSSAQQEVAFSRQCASEMQLPMRIVAVDHLLGGRRIVFYFTANSRVDFRALVHKLSSQYHTRIEMRQVGARDEARLVADYEKCGQRCCCQAFLKDLKPVSMRMAKIQKASLDPTKISGRCGRLMCCMRYENQAYEELRKRLPAKKTWVKTAALVGRVMDTSILSQLVRIWLPEGKAEVIANEEIVERDVEPPATIDAVGAADVSKVRSAQPADAAKAQRAREQDVKGRPPQAPTGGKRRGGRGRRGRGDKKARPGPSGSDNRQG